MFSDVSALLSTGVGKDHVHARGGEGVEWVGMAILLRSCLGQCASDHELPDPTVNPRASATWLGVG